MKIKVQKSVNTYFQVLDNSMNNGSIHNGILDGMILKCSEISKDKVFKAPLLVKTNYVIITTTGVTYVKSIKSKSNDFKIILESLNPNKNLYPDLQINLHDIKQIFIVDKRII